MPLAPLGGPGNQVGAGARGHFSAEEPMPRSAQEAEPGGESGAMTPPTPRRLFPPLSQDLAYGAKALMLGVHGSWGGGMVKSCWFRAGGGRKRWPVHSAAFGLFENQEGREGAAPRSGRPGSRPLRDLRESVLPRGSACDGRTSRPGPALTPAVSSAEHSSKLWSMAGTSGSSSDAIFPRPLPQR